MPRATWSTGRGGPQRSAVAPASRTTSSDSATMRGGEICKGVPFIPLEAEQVRHVLVDAVAHVAGSRYPGERMERRIAVASGKRKALDHGRVEAAETAGCLGRVHGGQGAEPGAVQDCRQEATSSRIRGANHIAGIHRHQGGGALAESGRRRASLRDRSGQTRDARPLPRECGIASTAAHSCSRRGDAGAHDVPQTTRLHAVAGRGAARPRRCRASGATGTESRHRAEHRGPARRGASARARYPAYPSGTTRSLRSSRPGGSASGRRVAGARLSCARRPVQRTHPGAARALQPAAMPAQLVSVDAPRARRT